MLSLMAGARIATCCVQEQDQHPTTGVWSALTPCGDGPARLDPDGDHLCATHWAQVWECAACHLVGQTANALRWSALRDASYCAACWAVMEAL
jgi:hypothetical protein